MEEKLNIKDEIIYYLVKQLSSSKHQSLSCKDESSWLRNESDKNSSFSNEHSDVEEITTKQTKNDESVLNINEETALIKLEKQLINVRKKYRLLL